MDDFSTKLLTQAASFCESEGMTPASLSEAIFGHKAFFRRIQRGNGCRMASFQQVQQHFIDHGYDPEELAQASADRESAA